MNENYIMFNGKRVDLTDEQIEKLGLKVEKKNPFKKVKSGNILYKIATDGTVINNMGAPHLSTDDACYNVANYCTDKSLLQQRAYHETLPRLLWRFSMQNDGDKIDWSDKEHCKCSIYYDHYRKLFNISCLFNDQSNEIYFYSKEIAQKAITEIVLPFMKEHPDFVW